MFGSGPESVITTDIVAIRPTMRLPIKGDGVAGRFGACRGLVMRTILVERENRICPEAVMLHDVIGEIGTRWLRRDTWEEPDLHS